MPSSPETLGALKRSPVGAADRPVYIMILEIQLTEGSTMEPLQQALDQLKPSLGVDLTFRALEQVRL